MCFLEWRLSQLTMNYLEIPKVFQQKVKSALQTEKKIWQNDDKLFLTSQGQKIDRKALMKRFQQSLFLYWKKMKF